MSFYDSIRLIVNILLVLIIIVFIIWLLKEMRNQKLNNRLNKYTITQDENDHNSLFDIIDNIYKKIHKFFGNVLLKSNYWKKYSLKYVKFIDKKKKDHLEPIDYVTNKFLLSFLALFILIISDVLQNNPITFTQIILAFCLGYFSLDLFLIGKKKMVHHQMENDLLKAITIMNNSFRSGRSIIQTIDIVSKEIDGPLQEEFAMMKNDLDYGLEIEAVFERFNERVDLKEVKYITTSLAILNKTGGNIIDVFSSIEKTVFSNKKLKDELYNLSASSRALYHLLSFVPLIFILVIFMIDRTYFMPLFTNPLGIIIIIFILIIYVLYIFIVKKIIKLKEY